MIDPKDQYIEELKGVIRELLDVDGLCDDKYGYRVCVYCGMEWEAKESYHSKDCTRIKAERLLCQSALTKLTPT